ncbi:MAG TPA: hypothetical protein VK698_09600 [Kofleriaceae bacterium]|nr:hypothetical protein [Kofleriaceae bacterium]
MSTKIANRRKRTKRRLLGDIRGLTTVEYIIILCLIAVVGFGVWQRFGRKVRDKVDGSTTQVDGLPTQTDQD